MMVFESNTQRNAPSSDVHHKTKFLKDFNRLLEGLEQENIFQLKPGRALQHLL
jgi:hypothetical protein